MCNHGRETCVEVRTVDLEAVRRHVKGIESPCKEVQPSDARVILVALRVLRLDAGQIAETA